VGALALPAGVLRTAILVLGATAAAAGGFGFALITLTLYSFFFNVKPAVAFLVIHSLAHNVLGLLTKHLLMSSLTYLPATIAGTLLGTAIFNRLSSEAFTRGLHALLVVLGLALLLK